MPDYSIYSMDALERMCDVVCKAYNELECPAALCRALNVV